MSVNYQQLAQQDAIAEGINPTYFVAQINQESGFNPNALSPAGAEGIAQFMPGTAAGLGLNPWDPIAALKAAAGLMKQYITSFGSEAAALSAYNYGPAGTQNAINQYGQLWEQHVPAETQHYISVIMGSGQAPTVSSQQPTSTSSSSNPLQGISDFFTTIGSPDTWIKIAFIVAGAIILLVGLYKLI